MCRGGGDLIGHVRFCVLAIAVGLIFSAAAAVASTTIGTDIFIGGTLTITGLSTFGNASSTLLSATNGLWVGSSGATSIFGSATSTFGAGISATYLNLSGTSATSTATNGTRNGVVASACKVIQSIAVSSATESTALHCMVSLSTNDYIELYAGNLTDTDDIIVKTINLFAMGL